MGVETSESKPWQVKTDPVTGVEQVTICASFTFLRRGGMLIEIGDEVKGIEVTEPTLTLADGRVAFRGMATLMDVAHLANDALDEAPISEVQESEAALTDQQITESPAHPLQTFPPLPNAC